jgi:hypothetical protein
MDKVMDIVKVGKLHFHQGIGILIGCASDSLADISVASGSYERGSILIVGDLPIRLNDYAPRRDVYSIVRNVPDEMSNEVIEAIRSSEAVIGWRSFGTYAASCLRKPVLELNRPEDDFWILTQWSNKYYVPLVVSDDDCLILKRGAERLWETVTLFRDSVTTMAPATSFVDNARD